MFEIERGRFLWRESGAKDEARLSCRMEDGCVKKRPPPWQRGSEKGGSYTRVAVERVTCVISEAGGQYVGLNSPKP